MDGAGYACVCMLYVCLLLDGSATCLCSYLKKRVNGSCVFVWFIGFGDGSGWCGVCIYVQARGVECVWVTLVGVGADVPSPRLIRLGWSHCRGYRGVGASRLIFETRKKNEIQPVL